MISTAARCWSFESSAGVSPASVSLSMADETPALLKGAQKSNLRYPLAFMLRYLRMCKPERKCTLIPISQWINVAVVIAVRSQCIAPRKRLWAYLAVEAQCSDCLCSIGERSAWLNPCHLLTVRQSVVLLYLRWTYFALWGVPHVHIQGKSYWSRSSLLKAEFRIQLVWRILAVFGMRFRYCNECIELMP